MKSGWGELENLEQEIHSAQEIREEADKKVEVAKKEARRYEKTGGDCSYGKGYGTICSYIRMIQRKCCWKQEH